MKNKLPYINKEDIRKVMKLADEIKQREGMDSFVFFRKLILCAMYGEMLCGRIAFNNFVVSAQHEYEKLKSKNETIFHFWDFKNSHNLEGKKTDVYLIPIKFIEETPIRRLEKGVIKMLLAHKRNIGIPYKNINLA